MTMSSTVSPGRYDLAVCYRIYPKVSKQPAVFANDKIRLARLCLDSFRRSLGALKVKMFVILDGCPDEFDQMFHDNFRADDLELIRLNGAGNQATFVRQIECLLEQNCSENIYFAEDDYFYLPGQFEVLLQFLRENTGVDFISPYDHPDYYTDLLHQHPNRILFSAQRHWRTTAATCLTFLTTKTTLRKTQTVFRTYGRGNLDFSLWLSLTKYRVLNPFLLARIASKRNFFDGYYPAKAWQNCALQILFGKRYRLWVPIPTAATHMEGQFLAPGVEWMRLFGESVSEGTVPAGTRAQVER